MDKIYTAKEINALLGYIDKSGSNSDAKSILRRGKNAGLEIEQIPTKRGQPNKYKIISNNINLENEMWIPCYANSDWEVSDLGRIRLITTKRLIGAVAETDGYARVCTINKETGKTQNFQVNRLVYFSFHPDLIPEQEFIQIDHNNGKRSDNKLSNLTAVTAIKNSENRDNNQNRIKTITTQLIIKYGYYKTEEMLLKLLTEE